MPLHRRNARAVQPQEKRGQMVAQIVAERFLETAKERLGPRRGPLGLAATLLVVVVAHDRPMMGFVRENAADVAAEPAIATRLVFVVCDAEKMIRRIATQGIEVGVAVIETVLRGGFRRENEDGRSRADGNGFAMSDPADVGDVDAVNPPRKRRDESRLRRPDDRVRREHRTAQKFHAVLRLQRGESACGPARPAVLVVEPCLQAEFFRLVGTGVDEIEPFVTEILGHETGARMHEKPAHAHFGENPRLPQEFVLLEPSVPRPKRLAAIGGGRVLPDGQDIAGFVVRAGHDQFRWNTSRSSVDTGRLSGWLGITSCMWAHHFLQMAVSAMLAQRASSSIST